MPRINRPALAFMLLFLAGCGNGTVIGSGPTPTTPPVTPSVTFEYPVPTAGAHPATVVTQNGYLYFTEQAASKIGQLTTGGAVTELATKTANAGPTSIIAGPDGNLWWTEASIHSIATSGSGFTAAGFTEYNIPFAGSLPNFMTRGAASGSMYFTDPGANAIGEILTSGAVSGPFAIPTAGSNPQGIAVGPDNNIWFTEFNTNKIGILNSATNAITEIPVSAGSHPDILVQGADGAMWFTEDIAGAPKLGRMTSTHSYSEFALTGAQSAVGLAVDLYGDLAVTDSAGSAIGIFKLSSQTYASYPTKTASASPLWITVGPEGKLYFTEFAADKIGQFSYF
ncbi:MAG: hypothetical protein ABR508_07960 [Candidatus Baltobacteraceae bacterium]